MRFFRKPIRFFKRFIWTLLIAFMLGIHNAYMQETKVIDDSFTSVQQDAEEESGATKD